MVLEVAVVNSYIWSEMSKSGYPGAPEEMKLKSYTKKVKGYHVAVFGDNHLPFLTSVDGHKTKVLNCGGLMRRISNEKERPCYVGLLWSDGTVTREELDCSEDKWIDEKDAPIIQDGEGMKEFLEELSSLGDAAINFADAVHRRLEAGCVNRDVYKIILGAMEK